MSKNRIRELRKASKMTQRELGLIVSYDQRQISRMELDRRSIPSECLERISDYFHVSTDYILCRTDDKITNEDARKLNHHLGEYADLILKYEKLSPKNRETIIGLIDQLTLLEHENKEES